MNAGYVARENLSVLLMTGMYKSKMALHIPRRSKLARLKGDTLYFDFAPVAESYQNKHILPDMEKFCLGLIERLNDAFAAWFIIYELRSALFNIVFECKGQRFETTHSVNMTDVEKEARFESLKFYTNPFVLETGEYSPYRELDIIFNNFNYNRWD